MPPRIVGGCVGGDVVRVVWGMGCRFWLDESRRQKDIGVAGQGHAKRNGYVTKGWANVDRTSLVFHPVRAPAGF